MSTSTIHAEFLDTGPPFTSETQGTAIEMRTCLAITRITAA